MGYDGGLPIIYRGTSDALVDIGPTVIHWILIRCGGSHDTVALYDGVDTSGELLATLDVQASRTTRFRFMPPFPFRRGLYLDIGSGIDEYTVAYDSVTE